MTQTFTSPQGRTIAFRRTEGTGPGVVFLGGFMSDMEGTKALALQAWAEAEGRAFLRFDYSGHGQSGGAFRDGAIGDWYEDALAAITTLTEGPQILVGSSMGGWISLLVARARPERVAGLVTIAAAPDFTEDLMWASFTPAQRESLLRDGAIDQPAPPDGSYPITRRLIEEARDRLVLRSPLPLPGPVRLLHGTADAEVPVSVALALLGHAGSDDIRLTLVKGADHRFSSPDCLALMLGAVAEVTARLGAAG
ncbi:alpha/beta hydrolase [Frigidibacter sp. MR17.24]|uniref:alpha/beta hydrolase n=1 Tax=Frigidibacter sp. MR17.24 TaxID=3127345 RepID=UPI003012ED39